MVKCFDLKKWQNQKYTLVSLVLNIYYLKQNFFDVNHEITEKRGLNYVYIYLLNV